MHTILASDINEPYMSKCSPELISTGLKVGDTIPSYILRKCQKWADKQMSDTWLPRWVFARDYRKAHPSLPGNEIIKSEKSLPEVPLIEFDIFDQPELFKKYVDDSIVTKIPQNINWHETPELMVGEYRTLNTRLRYLNRGAVYKEIVKVLGTDWSDKTIVSFASGKGVHEWLLGGLCKQVAGVEIMAKEVYICEHIQEILGPRSNVDFYLGDIETSYEFLIEKYKPDYLLFQMGGGFWRLQDELNDGKGARQHMHLNEKQKLQQDIKSGGRAIAENIATKYNIPYWYN